MTEQSLTRRLFHLRATFLWLLDSVRARDWTAARALSHHLVHLLLGGRL